MWTWSTRSALDMINVNNLRVQSFEDIDPPGKVMAEVPVNERAVNTVARARGEIEAILDGRDTERKIVIVGPCSIHNYEEALEYARRLNELRLRVADKMVIVMRTYFEKPRTTVGWKGFIYDPCLDGSYSLQEGVRLARKILVEINEMGLPTATEVLGPIVIQYYSDLICWSAIGARTTESQTHRELASGLSMPVGFKNGTEGNVDIAVNAILSARAEHHFLGMDGDGRIAVVKTKGNPYGHIILRGGRTGANYSAASVGAAAEVCRSAGVEPRMIIDCSDANSEKDYRKQGAVWTDVWEQIRAGRASRAAGEASEGAVGASGGRSGAGVDNTSLRSCLVGLMLESNLEEGAQSVGSGGSVSNGSSGAAIKSGVSITDGCIGWEETERLIMKII